MSLLDGLISHWKLDEESGTRYDSYGTHHLSDAYDSTPSDTDGIFGGRCIKFQDDPILYHQLEIVGISPAINTESGWTISGWFKTIQCDWTEANFLVISMFVGNPAAGPALQVCSTGYEEMSVLSDAVLTVRYLGVFDDDYSYIVGDVVAEIEGLYICLQNCTNKIPNLNPDYWENMGISLDPYVSRKSISINTWHFAILSWNGSQFTFQVDNGEVVTAFPRSTIATSINQISLGSNNGINNTDIVWWNAFSLWNRVLTSDERTTLWNSGAGLDYPFILGPTPKYCLIAK